VFDVRLYDSVGSTQDEAARLAAGNAPHGTVVAARQQTTGRGRHGRSWISPPGNVHLTVILRLGIPSTRAPEIGFLAALAVAETAETLQPHPTQLKWPNDVLLDGAKISGILVEQAATAVLLGMGINVQHAPEGVAYPVACLGLEVDPDQARALVLQHLGTWLSVWEAQGFEPVRQAWLQRAHPIGTTLLVSRPEPVEGRFAGLDPNGALLLDTLAGIRRFIAGDVAIA